MGCRNPRKAQTARDSIVAATGSQMVSVIGIDLAKMKHVTKFVENFREKFDRLDVIINNAATGVSDADKKRSETPEGLELVMATNHLGPLHLTKSLLPLLSKDGVVITMSGSPDMTQTVDMDNLNSDTDYDLNSETDYDPVTLYGRTKLFNIMMTRELAVRSAESRPGVSFYSVDPGFTWTNLHSSLLHPATTWGVWLAGPVLGAALASTAASTPVWLAGGGAMGNWSGEHWTHCAMSGGGQGGQVERAKLWGESEKLIDKALL